MSRTISDVSGKSFHYIVVGGGTSGLTLASRLTEDPSVHVLVLEAGSENTDDVMLQLPGRLAQQLGNPKYDWNLVTQPQRNCFDRTIPLGRGKTLGGSSRINFFLWTKPPVSDIDAWEKLGNKGWNWERFQKYILRAERFFPPSDENKEKLRHTFNHDSHGHSGSVRTTFPGLASGVDIPFLDVSAEISPASAVFDPSKTLEALGIHVAKDPLGGDPFGSSMTVMTIDDENLLRSDAMTAFYLPVKGRNNLHVLCDALVHRVILEGAEPNVKAVGVEFEYANKVHIVKARCEVILSSGALKSPQILELSGIGKKDLLEDHGVRTIIDLPSVGENLQDRSVCSVVFELDPNKHWNTLDNLADPEVAFEQDKLLKERKGLNRLGIGSIVVTSLQSITSVEKAKEMIANLKKDIERKTLEGKITKGLQMQYGLQLERLESGMACDIEVTCTPMFALRAPGFVRDSKKSYVSPGGIIQHPFSRGSIHIKTNDSRTPPSIDPHYFDMDIDLQILKATVQFQRRLREVEPMKNIVVTETAPGPSCDNEEKLTQHVKDGMRTVYHTVGTTSMLPRELGGVVDTELLVYGTRNLRVVDVGVVPLHAACHLQTLAYALGEAAADIIKEKRSTLVKSEIL